MKAAAVIVLYLVIFVWGCRHLGGFGRWRQCLLLGFLLGWAAYIHVSGMAHAPRISLASPYILFLQPAGEAIIQWLGR